MLNAAQQVAVHTDTRPFSIPDASFLFFVFFFPSRRHAINLDWNAGCRAASSATTIRVLIQEEDDYWIGSSWDKEMDWSYSIPG